MNAFQIEELSAEIKSSLESERTWLYKLNSIVDFLDILLLDENPLYFEAYFPEFFNHYLEALQNLSPFGIKPEKLEKIILNLKKILSKRIIEDEKITLKTQYDRINNDIIRIKDSLEGKILTNQVNKITFPVILSSKIPSDSYGQIESFTVKIHLANNRKRDKFIIVPSNKNIDKVFNNQIEVSWKLAVNFLKKYYKRSIGFHDIVIVFSHNYFNIVGYSLGVSMTIGFIQELFKFYNTPLSLGLKANTTFTGGVNNKSKVKPVGSDIIKYKTESVFYSSINYFAVPAQDFTTAKLELEKLKLQFPNRQLKLFNIEDLSDVIDHRQIISIEKAKIKDRTRKFVKKNSLALFLSFILLIIIGFYFTYLNDNNPYEIEFVQHSANILTKKGKILWTAKINAPGETRYSNKIYDINKDGVNEVILSNEFFSPNASTKHGRIVCFDNQKNLLWEYYFTDSISTKKHSFETTQFFSALIDIVEENGIPVLLAVARHLYFPSAIFKLDARTGERLDGTLWSQGHLRKGVVGDFNKDGNTEIFIGGINNAMESATVLLIDYNKMKGTFQTPNLQKYLFRNIPIANCNQYFLFSKTDVCNLLQYRFNKISGVDFDFNSDEYYLGTIEGKIYQDIGLVYRFNIDFTKVRLQIGDDIQFIRDSLVLKGKLNGPLTNDPLFSEMVKKGIKKWDGEKFISFYEK